MNKYNFEKLKCLKDGVVEANYDGTMSSEVLGEVNQGLASEAIPPEIAPVTPEPGEPEPDDESAKP